jgi:hypothetical protein
MLMQKVGNQKKKKKKRKKKRNVKTVKEPIETKMRAMKLSQIRRRTELCMRELILRFEMNL